MASAAQTTRRSCIGLLPLELETTRRRFGSRSSERGAPAKSSTALRVIRPICRSPDPSTPCVYLATLLGLLGGHPGIGPEGVWTPHRMGGLKEERVRACRPSLLSPPNPELPPPSLLAASAVRAARSPSTVPNGARRRSRRPERASTGCTGRRSVPVRRRRTRRSPAAPTSCGNATGASRGATSSTGARRSTSWAASAVAESHFPTATESGAPCESSARSCASSAEVTAGSPGVPRNRGDLIQNRRRSGDLRYACTVASTSPSGRRGRRRPRRRRKFPAAALTGTGPSPPGAPFDIQ